MMKMELKQFKYMTDLSEVMDKSGCDVPLTVSVFFSSLGYIKRWRLDKSPLIPISNPQFFAHYCFHYRLIRN